MMNSRAALLCALVTLAALTANAKDAVVRKRDGSAARYQLMPVHHDPAHASVVRERMLQVQPAFGVPDTYRIPKDVMPPIRDQGSRGTCVYFATVGQMEIDLIQQSAANKNVKVSEQCLVAVRNWMADEKAYTVDDKPVDYRPDPDGDYPQSVIKTVNYYGVPASGKYGKLNCKYGSASKTPLNDYLATMSSGGSRAYGKSEVWANDSQPTIEKLKALIAANIPVQVATLVYRDHFSTSNWDYRPMRDKESNLAGAHAIVLVGYRKSGTKTIFTFRNSWGIWGASGYGTIDNRLLEKTWSYDPSLDYSVTLQ